MENTSGAGPDAEQIGETRQHLWRHVPQRARDLVSGEFPITKPARIAMCRKKFDRTGKDDLRIRDAREQ